jgi:hypothetical protein
MIDHQFRNAQSAYGVGERAEPAHVADIDDKDDIGARERGDSVSRAIINALAEKEIKGRWPRGRVDNPDFKAETRQ